MKKDILNKLFPQTKEAARKSIKKTYLQQHVTIINFLYLGNAMHQRVFEKSKTEQQKNYTDALLEGDYLLGDGIALQVLTKIASNTKIQNLNGTDFTPFLIKEALKEFSSVHVGLRSVYDNKINKGTEWLTKAAKKFSQDYKHDINFLRQCPYDQRHKGIDKRSYEKSVAECNAECNILINCTGSPFQELRAQEQRERLERNNTILINAGGFVDFLSGFETRAPKRVRKMRVGETFRRIAQNPKKNIKKFLRMFGIRRLLFTQQEKEENKRTQ